MQVSNVAIAVLLIGLAGAAAAQTTAKPGTAPATPGLNKEAARLFNDFQNFGPHRAFVVGTDGQANWQAGMWGDDPSAAIASATKRCEARTKKPCTLHIVNNYNVANQDWRKVVPVRAVDAPDIGRLRPEPYWSMRGPQLATGLIVWSHGYQAGTNAANHSPQAWTGRFTRLGYDLYRFDREWISDWASDATALADAIAKAREMGYRRIVLAGQSAGAWVSLAALVRGAKVDGVISISAAHHGTVANMTDTKRARADWQHLVRAIKPGPSILLVSFAQDEYDVGGRMDDAADAFATSGVKAMIVDEPDGFKGHNAGIEFAFARKFGACIAAFIERGVEEEPCDDD
jgi:pimeloyl-ACP methyl ester carboxylesterase